MSARAASSLVALALLGSALWPRPAAAGPWALQRGEYFSEVSGSLFSSTSFHDLNGDRLALGQRIENRGFTSYNEVGWRKNLSLVLALTGRSVTAVSGFSRSELTNTGLTEAMLGLRWNLMNGTGALAVEADWNAPLGYDRLQSPLLGDGRQRLSGSVLAGSAFGRGGFAQASGGYLYRFESFGADSFAAPDYYAHKSSASFAIVSADAGWWIHDHVLLGVRYMGQSVISSSGGDDGKDLEPEASQHLVGPVVRIYVDERLDFKAGTLSTAAGKNALHFDQFWIALAFKNTKLNRLQGYLGGARP